MRRIRFQKAKRAYRILCIFMTVLMIWQGLPMTALAKEDGTIMQERTLNIATVQEFLEFAEACNDADYSVDLEVFLQSDLNLSESLKAENGRGENGASFQGIKNFSGVFHGDLHTISGLNLSEGSESIGLFCYVEQGAKVQDLRVKGTIDCSESKISAGGIAGINAGTIQGCYFKGTVSSLGECGGIVGKNGSSGSVVRCGSSGAVEGLKNIGGIVGENRGVITDCNNAAAVNADTRWLDFEGDEELSLSATGIWNGIQDKIVEGTDFGGIVGWSSGIIAGCSNKAVVGYQHAGKNIGGIVGRQCGQVIRCANSGRVYGKQDVGGIVGQLEPQMVQEDVEELGGKVSELHDLMGQMIEDMEKMGDDLHGDLGQINGKSREAGDTTDALLTEMRQVVEKNVEVINELARRIDYCMTHFSTALSYLNQALGKGDALINDLDQLKKDLDIAEKMDEEDVDLAKQKRLVLESGIGGKLTADKASPQADETVTITVHADRGYRLSKLTKTLYGKETEEVTGLVEGESFVLSPMPKENVTVSAVFSYVGDYVMESNPGGKAFLSEDQKTLQWQAFPGYQVDVIAIDGGDNLYEGGESMTVPECPLDGNIHTIGIHFVKTESEPETVEEGDLPVESVSGVGGIVVADKASVKHGETIRIAVQNEPGYFLDVLQIQGGENLAAEVKSGIYEYQVPDSLSGKVEISASFKPVKLIMESAMPGGGGSYLAADQEVVFHLTAQEGFSVKGFALKGEDGAEISCQRKYEDSEDYSFPVSSLGGKTGRLQVIFERQSSSEAVKEAKENLEHQTDHIVYGVENISNVSERIQNLLTNEDGSYKNPEDLTTEEMEELTQLLTELAGYVTDTGVATGAVLGDVGTIAKVSGPYAEEALQSAQNTMDRISQDAHEMSRNLQSAGKELQGIVDYLNALEKLRAVNLSGNFDQNSEKLKTQLDDVADLLNQLDKHAYLHTEKLENDMRAVNDKMNEVLNLMVNRLDAMQSVANGEDIIIDLSAQEDSEAEASRVSGCTNKGVIFGDRNAGGIAGTMGVEKTVTEQENKISVANRYHARSQMAECENRGFITVKTENGGGLIGELEVGYVHDCLAQGRVQGEEANYLGGIAGKSEGTIASCSSLTVLDGNNYVGGIAGQATEVRNCYSMVTVLGAKEWVGAILGCQAYDEEEEDVTIRRKITRERMAGNYYCNSSLYGINGVSLSGVAQAVSYQEMLSLENVPEAFSELGVTFIDADQNVLSRTELPYGTELSRLEYPEVKTASGEYMEWKGLTGKVLEGNLILQATEMTNVTILSGGQEGKNKPVALAEGTFTEEAMIHVEDYVGTAPADAPVGSICHFYKVWLENTELGGDTVTRVRLLRETEGKASVYRLDNGKWIKLTSKPMGSYEETQMQGTEAVFCVCVLKKQIDWTMILIVAALVVVIVGLLIVILELILKQRRRQKARKQFWNEGEEEGSDHEEE